MSDDKRFPDRTWPWRAEDNDDPDAIRERAIRQRWPEARSMSSAPMDEGKFVPVLLWVLEFNTPTIAGWSLGGWFTPDDYFPISGTPYAWQPLGPRPVEPSGS